MLSKDVAQPASSLLERGHTGHSAVDPGPRPAIGWNLTGQDHLLTLVKEHRLNQGCTTGWHQAASRLSAKNQIERVHEERLACTGLSGQGS